ncbi:hypothetical protein [Pseudomonas paracarnis]|uniref:hypothetical protein n=1 Tax=Pseudomonas paracarnis TaxID=2750625 RepID=UPI00249BD93D|nr:hypothetical protein [Pseudomonas paracarnis]MDI3184665.1 hypothetical protein [Pseudomonas paracarnis]
MAAKKKQTGESSSSESTVWTNVSKNPVILSDGSTVGAGEQTTPEQAEFAEGSLWEEHGVLVSGAPVMTDDGAGQIEVLSAEIETLRAQLLAVGGEKSALLVEIEELKKQIPPKE